MRWISTRSWSPPTGWHTHARTTIEEGVRAKVWYLIRWAAVAQGLNRMQLTVTASEREELHEAPKSIEQYALRPSQHVSYSQPRRAASGTLLKQVISSFCLLHALCLVSFCRLYWANDSVGKNKGDCIFTQSFSFIYVGVNAAFTTGAV